MSLIVGDELGPFHETLHIYMDRIGEVVGAPPFARDLTQRPLIREEVGKIIDAANSDLAINGLLAAEWFVKIRQGVIVDPENILPIGENLFVAECSGVDFVPESLVVDGRILSVAGICAVFTGLNYVGGEDTDYIGDIPRENRLVGALTDLSHMQMRR